MPHQEQRLGVHETLELHELLNLKTNCLAKAVQMQNQVNDPELKSMLQRDADSSRRHIDDLQRLLSQTANQ